MKETEWYTKMFNKWIGDSSDYFGKVPEYMFAPDLREKFWEMGLKFPQINSDNVKEYALKQGFFVIEPAGGEPSLAIARSAEGSGETFNITPPNGQPKEW